MNLVLDDKTLCDLECILEGQFHPLNTFMGSADWREVCMNLHLCNGSFFPLPVTLAVKKGKVKTGDEITLVDSTNFPIASMRIVEQYEPDIDWECRSAYGTVDVNHPYVAYKQAHRGKIYISGPLERINGVRHYDFITDRLTPAQSRSYFEEHKWTTIVGFQTRNPMHKAHYELTKYALSKTGKSDAKLLLNPVVGETQTVDIDYRSRVHCYRELLRYYDKETVRLSLLPLAMRMAGPREACLHALIRKNYGCTHFVVGRDHAGPSFKDKNGDSFYGPYEAQDMFHKYAGEIGIIPIVSKMIVYNESKNLYQPIDEIPTGDTVLKLSGTEFRRMLAAGEEIPDWFSYPEVVRRLQQSVKKRGICYYFIGLSGSGKTTFANMLASSLLEADPSRDVTILDGDIVRQHLSKGLGFSKDDRSTNVRRIGFVASEIVRHGGTVICANIAPYEADRLANRAQIESGGGTYKEIWVNTPLEVCEQRDAKGLYKLAREGKIKQFTGISDPFEIPTLVDFTIDQNTMDLHCLTK